MLGSEDDLILPGKQKQGLGADEEEAGGDPGVGEGVGEAVGLPVDNDEGDEEEAEEGDGDCGGGQEETRGDGALHVNEALDPPGMPYETADECEPNAGGEFDGGVLPRDRCTAITAFGAE